jgi:hypothetical protein
MSNSTSLLDQISSSQQGHEITANALLDAASPASIFGRHASACAALTWGYYGGRMLIDGVLTAIANATVLLSASTTNYVEATRAGVVSKNTTGFTAGSIPLYTIVTGASTVTSYTDERAWIDPAYMMHTTGVAITTADVTLTAAQARCKTITLTGTLTGNRSLIVPAYGRWFIVNNTAGAYAVTVKTSGGTGIDVQQGGSEDVVADGTNVIPVVKGNGILSLAMTDANTTLTAQQYSNDILQFTGTLTAQRNIVIPLSIKQFTVFNNTTGGFNLQFIGATGTGVPVAAGKRAIVYADGTNVVRSTADV